MNKLLTKIVGATLGLAMAIGVGVGAANNQKAKAVYATTGSYTLTFDANTKSNGTGNHLSADHSTVLTTSNVLTNGSYSFTYSKTTYYWLVSGSECVSNVSSTTNCYPGANQTIKVGKGAGDGTISFTVGEAELSITSLVITARGADNTVKLTIDEATESTRVQNLTNSLDDYTFTYDSAVRTVSLTGGAGKTSSNKVAYISQIVVNYSISQGSNYVVSFNSNGGTTVDSQSVSNSGTATANEPTAPTKRGFAFDGWYDNEGLTGNAYEFSTPVTDNITLYAKWRKTDLTAEYSPSLENGDYRISGEVTAIIGTTDFMVQNGNNVMRVNAAPGVIVAGNSIDLFGTFNNSTGKMNNLAYCEATSDDTEISQTPLSNLNDITSANKFKYFAFDAIQLNSGFSSNTASIKNSELKVYYYSSTFVNVGGTFNANSFAANDYVTIKGVVTEYNSNPQLQITNIEKLTQYTVTFETNGGTAVPSQNVLAGQTLEQPANPSKASDEEYNYTFAGWYDNQELTGSPYDFASAVNSSFTLYAKWDQTELTAEQAVAKLNTQTNLAYHYSKSVNKVSDTLTHDLIGVDGTSYTAWSNKTDSSSAVYAGQSAGGTTTSGDTIQLRSSNSNSGIVATQTGGKISKITVVWNSTTSSGRKIDIYGNNSAYTAATQLYNNSTQGTKLGSIVMGTSTELTVSGDYAYVGLRSNDGAIYLDSIEIEWNNVSYGCSNVSIRFGGLLSKTLWNKLDTNEHNVSGFGVMIASGDALNENEYIKDNLNSAILSTANPAPSIDNADIVDYYMPTSGEGSMATPVEQGDNYFWNLFQRVGEAEINKVFVAVAYIKIGDEYVFMKQVRYSAKTLAADYIANRGCDGETAEGSLAYLATPQEN